MIVSVNDNTPIDGPEIEPRQSGPEPDQADKLKSSEGHFVLNFSELPTGIWTPWAQVQCVECVDTNNPRWKGDVGAISELRPREDWEAEAICDNCGAKIWIDANIANEQRVVRALLERKIPAHMQQTGGMCSAAEVWSPSEESYVMVTATEEPDDGGTWFCVGVYHDLGDGDFSEGEYADLDSFDATVERVAEIWAEFNK